MGHKTPTLTFDNTVLLCGYGDNYVDNEHSVSANIKVSCLCGKQFHLFSVQHQKHLKFIYGHQKFCFHKLETIYKVFFIRVAPTIASFRKKLKTYLCAKAYPP